MGLNMQFKKKLSTDSPRKLPKHSAKSYGCWLLGQREYSARRLQEKLVERGYPSEQAQEALTWLMAQGFQSDSRFAELKIRELSKKYSNRVIKSKLMLLGISEEIADEKLTEMSVQPSAVADQSESSFGLGMSLKVESEQDRANKLVEKFKNKEIDLKQKQKIYRFLASKGFSSSMISLAIKELNTVEGEDIS